MTDQSQSHEVREREIPPSSVIDLKESFADDIQSFEMLEDLATSAAFSRFETRRKLAHAALSSFLSSPVQMYKITQSDEIYLYLTLNNMETAFFHIGSYPNSEIPLEVVPQQEEIDALTNLASLGIGKAFLD